MSTYKLNYTDSFVNRDAANSLCSNPENGFSDLSSFAQSEKAVQELLSQQTPMQATDDHLIVFSEGLRSMAVAKALRGAAEGKALAQVEAAEWKGRYELEKSRNLKLQHKECQNRQMEYLPRNSSMTISSPTQAHQVFLNYRGEQLRHNFISHLIDAFERHDINFVVDKYEQRGNDLKNLFVRIEESRIALAIFSTRYAESRWCMDELVKMKKLVDQEKLRVIPIFYKVKAQDVRGQEGEFGKNFWKLARKPSSSGDDIKNWKEALECISNKMGLSLRDKRFMDNWSLIGAFGAFWSMAERSGAKVTKLETSFVSIDAPVWRKDIASFKAQKFTEKPESDF